MSEPAAESAASPRYVKQVRFDPIGRAGQERIAGSTVFLCGCGALGSVLAEWLVRAGVGTLRIADRDIVDVSNLPRQTMYTEADAAAAVPKAIAAAERLRRVNSDCVVEPHVVDVTAESVGDLVAGADLILDGTDNFETRYLLNDVAHARDVPWVFAGIVGASGQILAVDPGRTACLRCVLPEPPGLGEAETCDTAGVVGPAVGVIASFAAVQGLRVLAEGREVVGSTLTVVDAWEPRARTVEVGAADRDGCLACGGRYDWLESRGGGSTTVLCGRNAVQIAADGGGAFPFEAFSERVERGGPATRTRHWVRFERQVGPADRPETFRFTVFRDGRTIVEGTEDAARAKSIYAASVGP